MICTQKLGVRKHAMVFNGSTHWDVLAAMEKNSDYLCQLVFVKENIKVKTGGEICDYRCVLVLAAHAYRMFRGWR